MRSHYVFESQSLNLTIIVMITKTYQNINVLTSGVHGWMHACAIVTVNCIRLQDPIGITDDVTR